MSNDDVACAAALPKTFQRASGGVALKRVFLKQFFGLCSS